MNRIALLILMVVMSLSPAFSQSYYYDVIAGEGYGVRFWGGSENWKIHMGNSAEYHFGPVTDYSLKTNMDATGGRGWTWGTWGSTPVAGLSNAGHMQIAGTFKLQTTNELEFGVGTSKESNAGKIAYQKFSDALDIVGAGTNGGNRKIRFWAEGGSLFTGAITMDTGDSPGFYTGTGNNELNRYLLLLNSPTQATASGLKAGGVLIADAFNYASPGKNDLVVKGNVGIGTPSPLARLHSKIAGSANTTYSSYTSSDVALVLQNGNSTTNNFNILTFSDASGYGVADVGTITNHTNHTAKLFFSTRPASSVPVQRMIIDENGNVGIGSLSPDQKLTVNGTVHATRVKVETTVPGPDYVFEESYKLPGLKDVKSFIDENKHLPEVPSAKEMEAKGIDVGEMNMLLLKKVEELTLYVIQSNEKINGLTKMVQEQEAELSKLKNRYVDRKD